MVTGYVDVRSTGQHTKGTPSRSLPKVTFDERFVRGRVDETHGGGKRQKTSSPGDEHSERDVLMKYDFWVPFKILLDSLQH